MLNEEEMTISIVWGIEDIRTCIEDNGFEFDKELTDLECFKVLKMARKHHVASEGITWDVLRYEIENIYKDRIK